MANARPFSISTLQDLSNDTKNTSMKSVLGLAIELQTFGSPGGLQIPNFGSVGLHPHTWPKWGCDTPYFFATYFFGSTTISTIYSITGSNIKR
jgi:hypothetical protein